MFTFGIFTTHIPYIAFVVFYAYFLIFGINKASSGEHSFMDSEIQTQISYHAHSYEFIQDNVQLQAFGEFVLSDFEEIIFKRKIFQPKKYLSKFLSAETYAVIFCRPPPFALA